MLDTRAEWPNIGPDFVERAGAPASPATRGRPAMSPAAPGRCLARDRPLGRGAQSGWWAEDAALFDAWFAGLADGGISGDCLVLAAPTRFHASYVQTHLIERLRIAVLRSDAAIRQVRSIAPDRRRCCR